MGDKGASYCTKAWRLLLQGRIFKPRREKIRVLEGGPWRHKGVALLMVHYDGLVRLSEVKIETIPLWILIVG
jgi:hypothetical protein